MLSGAYTLTDLGTLGGDSSEARYITRSGRVWGASGDVDASPGQLNAVFSFQDLNGNLQVDSGERVAIDFSLVAPVQVDVWGADPFVPLPTITGSIVYAEQGSMLTSAYVFRDANLNGTVDPGEFIGIGDPANGSLGTAVNGLGQAVGIANFSNYNVAYFFQDLNNDGVRDTGELFTIELEPGQGSEALDINLAGRVVGSANTVNGGPRAFLFDDLNENMQVDPQELVNLHTADYLNSVATSVNDQGVVTGFFTDSQLINTGFIFNDRNGNRAVDAGEMSFIPSPIGVSVSPRSINNHGAVVGQMSDGNNTYGFVYDPVNGLRSLTDLLGLANVAVVDASWINDSGRITAATVDPMQPVGRTAALLTPTLNSTPRATMDNLVLLADGSGSLRAFDLNDGSPATSDGLSLGNASVPLLARAPDGRVILIDRITGTIQRLTARSMDGDFSKETLWTGMQSGLLAPTAAALGPDGDLYVSNGDGNILKFNLATLSAPGVFISADPQPQIPSALLWNSRGELLVALPDINTIRRHDGSGSLIDDFSTSARGAFSAPTALIEAPWGEVLIASTQTNKVVAVEGTNGQFRRDLVESNGGGLSEPRGLALLPDGRLLVSSFGTNQVLAYDGRSGQYLGVFVEGSPNSTPITAPVGLMTTAALPPVLVGNTELLVFVQYDDELSIDPTSLDDSDLIAVGPSATPLPVELVSHNAYGQGSAIFALYRVIAPGGTWTVQDSGLYVIRLAAGAVSNTNGTPNASELVLAASDISIAQTFPIAELTNEMAQIGVSQYLEFTILYSESQFLDSAFDEHDIVVTGPNGYNQPAAFLSATLNPNGSASVNYRVSALDGLFDNDEIGQYAITLLPNQVFDIAGVPVSGGKLGEIRLDTVAPTVSFDVDALIGSVANTVDYHRFFGVIGSLQGPFLSLEGSGRPLHPGRATLGPDGNLYVINRSNNSIERFDALTGQWKDTFISVGTGGLALPVFAVFDSSQNLYVGDRTLNAVLRFNGTTGAYLGQVSSFGVYGLDGPSDGVISPDGYLYVTSENSNTLIRVSISDAPNSGIVMTANEGLNRPTGLVLGTDGRLYIANANGSQILWYNPSVDAFDEFIADTGLQAGSPVYLAYAPDGRLLVSNGSGPFKAFDGTTGAALGDLTETDAVQNAGHYFGLPKITPFRSGSSAPLTFWVSYADAQKMNVFTIDGDEIEVIRPDGSPALATVLQSITNLDSTRVNVQYAINPSSGTWSSQDEGVYQFRIIGSGVEDDAGNGARDALLASFNLTLDTAAPTVQQVLAFDITAETSNDVTITVTYQDDQALDIDRFSTADIRLVGPGFSSFAKSVLPGNLSPGATRAVQYVFEAPAGGFSATNNGTFVAQFQADEVYDLSGNALVAANLDAFTVDIPIIDPPDPYVVTNTNDSGVGSLRWAITNANDHVGADIITFNIPGSGVQSISLSSALPTITDTLTINGYSQSGATPNSLLVGSDAVRLIRLVGTNAGSAAHGLTVSANGSLITGLIIQSFSGAGLVLSSNANVIRGNHITLNGIGVSIDGGDQNIIGGTAAADRNVIAGNVMIDSMNFRGQGIVVTGVNASDNVIRGNYIGVGLDGVTPAANEGEGVDLLDGALNTIIGGNTAGSRNVISGNGTHGIAVTGQGTRIDGNYIGVDAHGTEPIANQGHGIIVTGNASSTLIGSSLGNVISASVFNGILVGGDSTTGTVILNNFIGTDVNGLLDRGNNNAGIFISTASNTTIGDAQGGGNLISGNGGPGVHLGSAADGVTILGNRIGTDVDGENALANASGILVEGNASNITIGNSTTGNLISGNHGDGIRINANVTNASISSNLVGLNLPGTLPLPNQTSGIVVFSPVTIGGESAGNVISGNGTFGVYVDTGGQGTTIRGNLIGSNAAGNASIGNGNSGIYVNTNNVTIGGTLSGQGNLIVGNERAGIYLAGGGSTVQGNLIGTDSTLTLDLGNGTGLSSIKAGIVLEGSGNVIGATPANPTATVSAGVNAILFNKGPGIAGYAGNNILRFNVNHSNTGLGIDLNNDGVTANDALDADAGPNELLNFPVISSAIFDANGLVLNGTLHSLPSTTFVIQFFANVTTTQLTHGPSEMYLGQQNVTTDADGNAAFTFTYASTLLPNGDSPLGAFITSTVALESGSTSEFSARRIVTTGQQAQPPQVTLYANDITIARSPAHTFVIQYTSSVGINLDSLDDSDIRVTGEDFNQLATLEDLVQDGQTGNIFATYRINNNVNRTAFQNRQLTISLLSDQVLDGQGTAALPQQLGVINTPELPQSPNGPTARLKVASSITSAGIDGLTIRVTYVDDDAIPDKLSLGTGDLRVTWGEGFSAIPTLIDSSLNDDGTRLIASYLFAAPSSGGFSSADNDTYTIRLVAGQVADSNGGLCDAATLGSFAVNVASPQQVRAAASSGLTFGQKVGRSSQAMTLNLLTDIGPAMIRLQGAGTGQIISEDGHTRLLITGTNTRSSLSISSTAASALSLDEIVVEGSLHQFVAGELSLSGGLRIAGSVGLVKFDDMHGGSITIDNAARSRRGFSLRAGDLSDVKLLSNQVIDNLNAKQWLDTGGETESINAPAIRRLNVTGALQAGLHLQPLDWDRSPALGQARIGSTGVNAWAITGKVRNLTIGSASPTWTALFSGGIDRLRLGGQLWSKVTGPVQAAVELDGATVQYKLTPVM